MCGRAGRRGIDKEGDIFIFFGDSRDMPNVSQLRPMLQSKGEVLESKFKLTYSTIINSFTMNNFKVKDLMKKSFTENKSYLKISTLNRRNDHLHRAFESNQIICPFSETNPLKIEEKTLISLHESLINEMRDKCVSFRDEINPKQLNKILELPLLVFVVDQKGNFNFVIVNHFKVDRNEFIFEGFFCENQTQKSVSLKPSKFKKTKYLSEQNQQLKVFYYEFDFGNIVSICDSEGLNPKDYYHSFQFLREKQQGFLESKSVAMKASLPDKMQAHFLSLAEILNRIVENKCFSCEQLVNHRNIFEEQLSVKLEIEQNEQQI